jgi:hypothetical protein
MWYELTTSGDSIFCCEKHIEIVSQFWREQEEYKKYPHKCVIIPRLINEPQWSCGECHYEKMIYDETPVAKLDLSNIKKSKFRKNISFHRPDSK